MSVSRMRDTGSTPATSELYETGTDASSGLKAPHVDFGSLADNPSHPQNRPLSALVQKRTNAGAAGLSAKCHKQTHAPQQIVSLFDDLVGNLLKIQGHFDAERTRRLQVDDELEFGRLHHWQIGGLSAVEDAAGIDADVMNRVREVGSVAH